jgi:hypothetical protein
LSWWDVLAGLDGRRNIVRTIYSMPGTWAGIWMGPPADVGRAVGDRYWYHQPVFYPARPYPMNRSVKAGVAEHVRLMKLRDPRHEWAGVYYSQSAIVWYHVYQMMLPGGELEDYMDSWRCTVTFGNPCREKGVAHGNRLARLPIPKGRGIAPYRFSNTDPRQLDFAHVGDLYTDTPDDKSGEDITSIFNVVFQKWLGTDTLSEQLLEIASNPVGRVPYTASAVFRALRFFGSGTRSHINYDISPAVAYLRGIGERVPATF